MNKHVIQSPKFIEHFNYICIHSFIHQMFLSICHVLDMHTWTCIQYRCMHVCARMCKYRKKKEVYYR